MICYCYKCHYFILPYYIMNQNYNVVVVLVIVILWDSNGPPNLCEKSSYVKRTNEREYAISWISIFQEEQRKNMKIEKLIGQYYVG